MINLIPTIFGQSAAGRTYVKEQYELDRKDEDGGTISMTDRNRNHSQFRRKKCHVFMSRKGKCTRQLYVESLYSKQRAAKAPELQGKTQYGGPGLGLFVQSPS